MAEENLANNTKTLKYNNGDVYNGYCHNNIANVFGTCIETNGNIYRGEWKYGVK